MNHHGPRSRRLELALRLANATQVSVAKSAKLAPAVVSQMKRGDYENRAGWAALAKALGVGADWLIDGIGDPPDALLASAGVRPMGGGTAELDESGLSLPLAGTVTAGDGWVVPSQDPDDNVPVIIKSRWRAVRIQGTSAIPIALPGQCVLVDDALRVKNGRIVCVQTNDGRAYCKRYCEAGDHVVLAGLNTGQDSVALHLHEVSSIAVVVGTIYTDSVAR